MRSWGLPIPGLFSGFLHLLGDGLPDLENPIAALVVGSAGRIIFCGGPVFMVMAPVVVPATLFLHKLPGVVSTGSPFDAI